MFAARAPPFEMPADWSEYLARAAKVAHSLGRVIMLVALTDTALVVLALALTMWLLVAFAAGWLADQRGRSALVWFFLGLVWGPFAALLVGLAPRGASGPYRRCPHCWEPIRREAAVCPYCQRRGAEDG
jgi:hypothetical protein